MKTQKNKQGIGFFERYLTLWVALCIMAGIGVGQWLPGVPAALGKFEYANVSIPGRYSNLVDDLPDDAQSGFSEREECRKKAARHHRNVRDQLAY